MLNKPTKIRSKKIRSSAEGETCTLREAGCDWDTTVVFCHLPGYKGTGTKNHDLFGVYGCYPCHQRLDSGKVDTADKLRAFQETLLRLVEKGLIKVELD